MKRPTPDEHQADLFGMPPAKPPRAPRRRRPTEPPAAEPPSFATLAETATRADLDAFVASLPDEALSHLTLESLRTIKRRLGPSSASRPQQSGRPKRDERASRASLLDRAVRELAAAWANSEDDAW